MPCAAHPLQGHIHALKSYYRMFEAVLDNYAVQRFHLTVVMVLIFVSQNDLCCKKNGNLFVPVYMTSICNTPMIYDNW